VGGELACLPHHAYLPSGGGREIFFLTLRPPHAGTTAAPALTPPHLLHALGQRHCLCTLWVWVWVHSFHLEVGKRTCPRGRRVAALVAVAGPLRLWPSRQGRL